MLGYKYLLAYLAPLVAGFGLLSNSLWAFFPPIFVFVLIPIGELLLPAPTENADETEEQRLRHSRLYDLLIYSMVPIQYALLGLFVWKFATEPNAPLWQQTARVIAMGLSCGILGINVAHELGHRRRRYEQNMAKALLATTLYMHFFIEHNRGHHTRVSTHDDPATSRYGENLYVFWVRSVVNSFRDAWDLERKRMLSLELPLFHWKNEMVRMMVWQGALLLAIALLAGPVALLAFLAASLFGILLLETVNYIEHYGLSRRLIGEGRYERVLPIHSWNSNHLLGRMLLFELTRHSDHHANARRHYQTLRHFDESPQLPTGYPGMMVLAVIPPLWFAVMHPHIAAYRKRFLGEHAPDAHLGTPSTDAGQNAVAPA